MPTPKRRLSSSGLPIGLPDKVYATWVAVLADIKSTDDARHAAERYQFLTGFSQALIDAGLIDEASYSEMRTRLMGIWVETVNRVDQDVADRGRLIEPISFVETTRVEPPARSGADPVYIRPPAIRPCEPGESTD